MRKQLLRSAVEVTFNFNRPTILELPDAALRGLISDCFVRFSDLSTPSDPPNPSITSDLSTPTNLSTSSDPRDGYNRSDLEVKEESFSAFVSSLKVARLEEA